MHDGESERELVAGMAHDVRHLGEQYLELIKIEVEQGVAAVKRELIKRVIGGGALAVGALFLAFALVYLATDELGWPRWLAFGILALAACGAGSAVMAASSKEPPP